MTTGDDDPRLGFPAVWLRHNCPCADCRDPVTGQRLTEITDIPNGCVVTVVTEDADSVSVGSSRPTATTPVFSRAWLAANAVWRPLLPRQPA